MTVKIAQCRWCDFTITWNARKQRWQDDTNNTFCPDKKSWPFVHEANEGTIAFTADVLATQ